MSNAGQSAKSYNNQPAYHRGGYRRDVVPELPHQHFKSEKQRENFGDYAFHRFFGQDLPGEEGDGYGQNDDDEINGGNPEATLAPGKLEDGHREDGQNDIGKVVHRIQGVSYPSGPIPLPAIDKKGEVEVEARSEYPAEPLFLEYHNQHKHGRGNNREQRQVSRDGLGKEPQGNKKSREPEVQDMEEYPDGQPLLPDGPQPALDNPVDEVETSQRPSLPVGYREQDHDRSREDSVAQQQEPFRMEPEDVGKDDQQSLDKIYDKDRLGLEKAQAEEPVMEVAPVGRKRRSPLGDAFGYDSQGIQYGKPQQDQGQKGAKRRAPLGEHNAQRHRRET